MSEGKITRLASAAKELNVGTATIVEHLHAKGFKDVANSPNTKLTEEQYDILLRDFRSDIVAREKAEQINIGKRKEEGSRKKQKETKKQREKQEEREPRKWTGMTIPTASSTTRATVIRVHIARISSYSRYKEHI